MRALRTVALLSIVSWRVIAQTDTRPKFEVASVRPSSPDARGMTIRGTPGGRIMIANMTLKDMMVIAWHVQPYQISGGLAWLNSAHFDISAKPENSTQQEEIPLMLQSLLEDRFQLTIRRETKEMTVYALVMARKDGTLGPKLTEPKAGGCPEPDPSKPAGGKLPCGGMMVPLGRFRGASVQLTQFAESLSRVLGRTVVDKTGLIGRYDLSLEWTIDDAQTMTTRRMRRVLSPVRVLRFSRRFRSNSVLSWNRRKAGSRSW